jgi:hypothetical protein
MALCIVCGSAAKVEAVRGQYQLCRCPACGLQFSNPMAGATANYADAYDRHGGPAEVAGEGLPYLGWTAEASPDLSEFPSFLTAAQQFALQLAQKRFAQRPSLPALDIGFGAGWFLGAARSAGFVSYGLEAAEAPVGLLQKKGFQVCRSPNGELPGDWPTPTLITAFEVVEHLEDPIGFLTGLCRSYPEAEIMLSVPDERRWFLLGGREAHDYPPNHLTRWSAMALNLALRKAGFQHARVWRVRPTAQELSMASLRRFLLFPKRKPSTGNGINVLPSTTLAQELGKRRRRKKMLSPAALLLPMIGRTACSMVAWASNRDLLQ